MKILCLYNNDIALELFDWIRSNGHETIMWRDRLEADWCFKHEFDLTVSYTYRYIVKEDVLKALQYNAVNIHNAYLPFNRGADPNLWSILDNTPRGVTLHYMNEGLDKGGIISQVLLDCVDDNESLKTTYSQLDREAKELFKKSFPYYGYWQKMTKEVCGKGSYHKSSDGDEIRAEIETYGGYGITIKDLKLVYAKLLGNK